jgi:predicted transcriptional regulator
METISLTPERKAQLDAYAQRHGQDAVTALDEVLADALAWDQQEFEKSVSAIRQGYEDVKAGRTRPASEFLEEVRAKYDFSR